MRLRYFPYLSPISQQTKVIQYILLLILSVLKNFSVGSEPQISKLNRDLLFIIYLRIIARFGVCL